MAARPEGQAVRLLPASPVIGRLIQRIRALDGDGQKRKNWAPAAGDQAMGKLLDMASRLALLHQDLAGIEKTFTVAADLAPRLLQIRDATQRPDDLLDELEYGRLCSRLAKDSEVRPHKLLISSILSGRSKHSKNFVSNSFKIDQRRLLDELVAAVAQSMHLITLLAKGKDNNQGASVPRTLALDPWDCIAATVSPEHRVFGRKDEQDNIVHSLIHSSYRLSVVFVVGRCGVGKTTLAQLVYNDTRVEQHFDLRIWVSVSGALNKMDITREILQSADPSYVDKMARADFQMLQSELSSFVASHRLLLVLDDLLEDNKIEPLRKEIWTEIFAPLHSAVTGSSILVTTPMMMIAKMLGTSQPYVISTLDKSKCSDLFMECAISSKNSKSSPELQHIAMEIADKVQGLPLAAKVLGGVIGATNSTQEWRSIMDRKFSGDVALHSVQLSYDFLPAQIKECFAYCALFPKNWKFDRTKLIHLWMAEGFLELQGQDPEKRMEDLGSKYFDALVSLSFFQRHKQGSKTYYMMHHWFHDLAEAVSTNVYFRIEPGSTDKVPPTVSHLSVTTDSPLDLNAYCLLKRLRTLLVLRSPLYSLQDDHLKKLKNLRVLDLCGCNLAELPETIGELVHLRYLSLCGTLRRLPESLSRLLHLQILHFPEYCCLDELPTGTTSLINLRHLDIDTKYIAKLASIRHLVNLQGSVELYVEKGGHNLQDLRDINGLCGQLKISGLDNVSSKEEVRKAKLNNKLYLKILKLEWTTASRICGHTTDAELLENLQPHPNIRELFIRRYAGSTAPSWLQFLLLKGLQSLHLINCRNLSILPPLGQLPSLENLHMKELCAVTQIGPEFYRCNGVAFPSLKVLELVDFPRLLEWSVEANCISVPCLRSLRLVDCPELKQIPSLPARATEVTIERICSIRRLKLVPFSSNSSMLTLDSCMTTVLCKRLFHQQHLESITVLSINGGKLFPAAEGLGSLLSLQKLQLCQSDMTDHNFSLFLQALPSLSSLELIDLPNITVLPLQEDLSFFLTLVELHIRNCPLLSSLSSLQTFVSLKCLVIERCPKVTAASLPRNFGSLVSLKMLSISYCSQLQSMPGGGFPSSLQALNLTGCHPKLVEESRNRKHASLKIATCLNY